MVNSPYLLENLILLDMGKVDGKNEGLEIHGKGTFKFTITDNNGMPHNIPSLSTIWVGEMPPVTTTLGAGGGSQQNIDGEFCILLHPALGWRPVDRVIQHLDQHPKLLHGSFCTQVSGICHHI
jgi:hypothetical protein